MKIFKYMALALAAVVTMGCVQEYMEVDPDKVPSASELQVKIDVDQATNYVTFSVENEGVVPMWLFGEEQIDGKANKKYAYTGNGLQLRLRDAGTHSVEVKAYNAHGISVGSKVVEFTLENTYRDPFDPSKYVTFFAGNDQKVWQWNSTVKGHFGCGESGTDGTNWWSAGPDEKKDWGLYDDRLTFTKDMKYTYDPGEGGMVYVNKDSGYGTEYNTNDGNDYMVPIEGFTTDYSFENAWNDVGIEEIYLVLPANTNLSYIPNPEAMAEPRYKLLEGTNTKKLALVHDNGGIAWKYEFVVEGSNEDNTKPDTPTVAPFDPAADENMWKDAWKDSEQNITYWFANAGWGQIADPAATIGDNEYTFVVPEGIGGNEWQGQVVFRNTGLVFTPDKNYDFRVIISADADGTATIKPCWEHPTEKDGNGNPADVNELFYDNGIAVTAYEDLEYVKAGLAGTDIPDLKLVFDLGRFPAGTTVTFKGIVFRESKVVAPEPETPDPLDPTTDANLWKNAAIDISYWFANNNWGQIADPELTQGDNEYTLIIPEGIGGQQWQGQFVFNRTGIVLSPDKTYDFQVTLYSEADHPHVTVKPCYERGPNDDINPLFEVNDIALAAYEEYVFTKVGLPGTDIPDLKLVFDFAGAVGGSKVIISGITLIEH